MAGSWPRESNPDLIRISHRRLWGSPWRRHSCLPRPHSWGRSWFDTVSLPQRVSRRVSTRQARVPASRRLMGCEYFGLILILAVLAISAPAQVPELRVSLRELTGEAIKNNPSIAAAQKKYEAARQRP